MNQDDRVAQLLDAAVPPIPPALRIAPYERIRRRAHRRRLATIGSAAAVVVLLSAGLGVAFRLARPDESTVVGGPPVSAAPTSLPEPWYPAIPTTNPPLPGAPADAVSWDVLRVDRTGLGLIVYVNPLSFQDCLGYPSPPTAIVNEGADAVTITMIAKPGRVDCDQNMATPVRVTLRSPLGDRAVRDGRDGTVRVTLQERYLPVVPGRWWEVPTSYSFVDGGLTVNYTQPGGPDLEFLARVGTVTDTGPTVVLGSRRGVIVDGGRGVGWQVGDMVYSMQLEPAEGRTSTLDELLDILDQLTWP